MTVGERIKAKRLELGMSQEELAKKCGYKSRSSINKIELERDLPLRKVEQLARALNTDPIYLMGWEDELQKGYDAAEEILDNLCKIHSSPMITELNQKFIKLSPSQQKSILALIDSMIPDKLP